MRRTFLILLLVVSVIVVCATPAIADGVKLALPGTGPYQVWFDTSLPSAAKADAQTIAESSADLAPPAGTYIAVLDSKSGNLAIIPPAKAKGTITLKTTDFNSIGEVRVSISHNGLAVGSGSVELNDGRSSRTAVLDPSRVGTVSFYGVKPGQLKVTVHYVTGGKDADPLIQLVKQDIDHSDPVPTIAVALTADVATLPAKPGSSDSASGSESNPKSPTDKGDGSSTGDSQGKVGQSKSKEPDPGSILGRIVGYVLGLGFIAALIWGLYFFLIKNPAAAAERLTALGVQIPKQQDDPMDLPAVAVPSAAPQPIQKIVLEDSAPTPLAASPVIPTAAAIAQPLTFTDRPRLVANDGEELYIQDGTTTVGREAGLGLSLVDEPTLSRKHAELVRTGSQLLVRDLGSTNGTFVNGRKVSSEVPLNPGDTVQFGSVQFTVYA